MLAPHNIPSVPVLNVNDVVTWNAADGPRSGAVSVVGDNYVVVNGYWFTGDARARLRKEDT